MARIKYRDPEEVGVLIYLKTTLLKGLSVESLGYRAAHDTFPDDTTVDQFFSEEQFEAYRELGCLSAENMLWDVDSNLSPKVRDSLGLPEWLRHKAEGL